MNISSITELNHAYLQSVLGTVLQETGLSSSSSSTSGSRFETQRDNGQLPPFAHLWSTLQQLQESNPAQYQQVTQQIATNLQNATQTVTADDNTTAAPTDSGSNPNATTSVTPNSSSTATSNDDTQTPDAGGGVNPYLPPTQQTAAPPAGYQYVPFGTGTSVVPTMANWLAGWQQANSNLSPSAQQNQILNYGAGQGSPMYGANLPGTNIPWSSLTQEQQAAYVQATSIGQSISDLQQFLSQYQGPDTPGNESYDQAIGSNPQATT